MEHKIINCPHCGKIIPDYLLKGESIRTIVTCPECRSQKNFKNGFRKTNTGKVQCYICRDCGYRFS